MVARALGLITTVRSMGNATGVEVLNYHKTITPDIMFYADASPRPNVWTEPRKFLVKTFPLIVHEKRRAVFTLASSIFLHMEEEQLAIELTQRALSADNISDRRRVAREEDAQNCQNQYCRKTVAHNFAMRLRDASYNFSRDLGQCWQVYVGYYN